jgi:hypothetical protein
VQSDNNIGHSSIIPMPIFDVLARCLLETEVSIGDESTNGSKLNSKRVED